MHLTQFNQIADEINKFYLDEATQGYHPAIFVLTKYTARQLPDRVIRWAVYKIKLRTFFHNLIEFIKSRIKSRMAEYKKIKKVILRYEGLTSIDLTYGTVVVVHKTFVDKFYFKQVTYFEFLYKNISFLQPIMLKHFPHYLMMRQIKYPVSVNQYSVADVWRTFAQITPHSNDFLPLHIKMHTYFSISYKVEQLFNCYFGHRHGIEPYLNICTVLDAYARPFSKKLCHGDLWAGNIFGDSNTKLIAIDFDKMIFFCSIYDVVYFYLMTRVLPKTDLKSILIDIDKYAIDTKKFFSFEYHIKTETSHILELKVCIFLFVFIKLLEQDLHQNKCGNHVRLMRRVINNFEEVHVAQTIVNAISQS